MYDDSTLFAFLAIGGFLVFLFSIIGIVLYVLASVGLYKLAANRNIANPWLAFIPVANLYILGLLVKTIKLDSFEIPNLELVLPLGFIAAAILRRIPLIGWLANIAYLILTLITLYKLYKMYRSEQATLWLILSIVLPFMGPIFLFIMRNDTPRIYNS